MILVAHRIEKAVFPAKHRLILHAGTTKTGSTTLQVFLYKYRQALIEQGILYPGVGIEPHSVQPKHQWIVNHLLSENTEFFFADVDAIRQEMAEHPNIHSVILSTEGIYNHWWDYTDAAKSCLRKMEQFFDVTVWVVFREPISFAKSHYGQMVKNPKSPLIPCYATPDPLEVVIDDYSFSRTLRYADFVRSVEALFGRPIVLATKYEDGDIIDQARKILGFNKSMIQPSARENPALSEISLEMVRRINRQPIDPADRQRCIDMISEIDKLLGQENRQTAISETVQNRIDSLTKLDRQYLKDRYNIQWT